MQGSLVILCHSGRRAWPGISGCQITGNTAALPAPAALQPEGSLRLTATAHPRHNSGGRPGLRLASSWTGALACKVTVTILSRQSESCTELDASWDPRESMDRSTPCMSWDQLPLVPPLLLVPLKLEAFNFRSSYASSFKFRLNSESHEEYDIRVSMEIKPIFEADFKLHDSNGRIVCDSSLRQ